MSVPVVLLGPQRFDPTLGDAVRELDVMGPIATITAGWQERELEDAELDAHLGSRTVNLRLYQRTDDVWQADPELRAAHRARQDRLRQKQDFYRVRLDHELEAAYVIQKRTASRELLDEEYAFSIRMLQQLDAAHLEACRVERERFDASYQPLTRPAVVRHRDELREALSKVSAIAIAGGHVATLLNRLELFGMDELIVGKPIFAWSAGAMAISERVVLFHDTPPQGRGAAQVLDRGLGLVPRVVPLPHPEERLRLEDEGRVALLAHRFAPALCLAFRNRTRITWGGTAFARGHGVECLRPDGKLERYARWDLDGRGEGESLALTPGAASSSDGKVAPVDLHGLLPGYDGSSSGGASG